MELRPLRHAHHKGRVLISLDSALFSGHDEPGATETAAVLSFTDGIEVSINAVMTVQSDYMLLYFLTRFGSLLLSVSIVRIILNLLRYIALSDVQRQTS
jgi:hypothetical protein